MFVKRSAGLALIHICVAVNTAVGTRVVSSNVGAFCAAAFLSRGLGFVLEVTHTGL